MMAVVWIARPDARAQQQVAPSQVPRPSPDAAVGTAPDVKETHKPPAPLEGVDLATPSQQAFREWPSQKLLDRPYWLPWTPATLQRAAVFGQPILVLMTVPWNRAAQRMQGETLADAEVLRAINDGYVSVNVAADRRPDLRERYQTGSWPSLQLLLPDIRPILSQANPTQKALPIAFGLVDSDTRLFLLREGRIYFDKWSAVLSGVADVYDVRRMNVRLPIDAT